ncbi:type II secretion system F family protein [Ornithinimicrobium cavernae]|uniref:type II secretion system F family protein n=1 Tax=Ornithinimicrobium cavernae TaxID=2666047 RepID=UPI000D68DE79|nr:type II secretion system F family protein [Ornithinimicrobium cavernae]
MNPVVPALAGALVVGGLLAFGYGLVPRLPRPPAPRRGPGRLPRMGSRTRTLLLVGVGVGVLVAILTGWIVAVVVVPAAVAGLPLLLAAPAAKQELARLEAMNEWVRSVAGVLTAGVGLEQALITSLRSTPDPIRPEVSRLVGRLRARWDTQSALRAFADDLDDPTGDLIASNLLLGARRRGAGLSQVLEALAESVTDDVKARREIESDRAKPRGNARLITFISLAVLGVLSLSGSYIEPYSTPLGQVVLLMLLSGYVGSLLWMKAMSRSKPIPRFIGSHLKASAS